MNVNIGSNKKDSKPTAQRKENGEANESTSTDDGREQGIENGEANKSTPTDDDRKQGKENGKANKSTPTDDDRKQGKENGKANKSTPTDDDRKQGKENGKANKSTPTVGDCRKRVIKQVVDKEKPHLVLFQEFNWEISSLKGKVWKDYRLDEKYMFYGEGETGLMIMYDKNEFEVQPINADELSDEISKRMSICKIKSSQLANVEFICVTWHGEWKCSPELKSKYLENLLEFLKKVCREQKRPLLIGGDFNLKFEKVESIVKGQNSNFKTPFRNFKVPSYAATKRRENNVLDMFITMDIDLDSVEAINIEDYNSYVDKETNEQRDVLDHDPISGVLCVRPNIMDLYDVTMMVTENQTQIMTELVKLVERMKNLESTFNKIRKSRIETS